MRKSTKSAIAITLAIAGAIASSFSSNASALELKEDSRSFCNPTRIELKGQGIVMLASVLRFTKMDAGEIDRLKKAAFGV